jgi:hypothetical protein
VLKEIYIFGFIYIVRRRKWLVRLYKGLVYTFLPVCALYIFRDLRNMDNNGFRSSRSNNSDNNSNSSARSSNTDYVLDFIDSIFYEFAAPWSPAQESEQGEQGEQGEQEEPDKSRKLLQLNADDENAEDKDVDSISPEEISQLTFHNEPIWRCATLLAPAPAPDFFMDRVGEPADYMTRPPRLSKGGASTAGSSTLFIDDDMDSNGKGMHNMKVPQGIPPLPSVTSIAALPSVPSFTLFVPHHQYTASSSSSLSSSASSLSSSSACSVPDVPMLLMQTHFEVVNMPLNDLIKKIECCLKDIAGLSFEHYNFEVDSFVLIVFSLRSVMWCVWVQWNVVYVNGPSHCKLELNIYNGFTRGYIVEANRLNVSLARF